jgi:Tryptophan-rich Synechocystis species C-terminal domain
LGPWAPIGAEQTASGYEVGWKAAGADQYSVWNTDNSGNFIPSTSIVSGADYTLQSFEPSFHQDLNGDGQIGVPTTVIEANGSTHLTEVGNHFFLYDSNGAGPLLKFFGADIVAGQFALDGRRSARNKLQMDTRLSGRRRVPINIRSGTPTTAATSSQVPASCQGPTIRFNRSSLVSIKT